MFKTFQQARAAITHLNPKHVRDLSARIVRVGLISSSEAGYARMEETLVPVGTPADERAEGMAAIFRGGDPNAPKNVDVVLYEEGIPWPAGAYTLYRDNPAQTVADILGDHDDFAVPLGRQFPGLRKAVVERFINHIARENALFAIATALPDVLPNIIELPWVFGEWASDTAFLTANQIRMAFLIAGACGHEVGFAHQKAQVVSIGAGAFGWRAIARELAGKIPLGGGLIAKGAIAYAGTYAVGKGLELLHHGDMSPSREDNRQIYQDALKRGKEIAQSLVRRPGAYAS